MEYQNQVKDLTRELKALYKMHLKDMETFYNAPQPTITKQDIMDFLKNNYNRSMEDKKFGDFIKDTFNSYYYIPLALDRGEYSPSLDAYARTDKAKVESVIQNINDMNITIQEYLRVVSGYTHKQIDKETQFLDNY
jgi:hypothetical protein